MITFLLGLACVVGFGFAIVTLIGLAILAVGIVTAVRAWLEERALQRAYEALSKVSKR